MSIRLKMPMTPSVAAVVGGPDVQRLLESAVSDPWGTLGTVLDGPLHPGGVEATERLLERADVGPGTELLDVGCGAGESITVAERRGAEPIGLDSNRRTDGIVQGDLSRLPFGSDTFDVVLAECVLCLSDSYPRAVSEAARVLCPGGRLAFSDVVFDGERPDVPPTMADALCLGGNRDRNAVLDEIETAGFDVSSVRSHRGDLLAMRDELAETIDYERLLGLMGSTGERVLAGIEELEAAVEEGRLDYVSLVATAPSRI